MQLIPAIDLKGGKCVRLLKGDFDKTTEYSDDPLSVARTFAALDVSDLHVVDLDGARTGDQSNRDIVAAIASETPLDVQIGGGIRSMDVLKGWLDAGVRRAVIGSLAVTGAETVAEWMGTVGADRIVLALDVRLIDGEPMLTTHGWTEASDVSLWSCIERYLDVGLQHVLCTDVSRDGALAGPNLELYSDVIARYPSLKLQASGGIRDLADLEALRGAGIPAAISGKAMLDGRITPEEVSSFRQSA